MRDQARIEPLLRKVQELWELYPDFRLGQMVSNVAGLFDDGSDRTRLIEDDAFEARLDDWIFRARHGHPLPPSRGDQTSTA